MLAEELCRVAFLSPHAHTILRHESYRRDLASRALPDSNSATFPSPRPPLHEVLVQVEAVGVNFADVLGALGRYPAGPNPPYVMGREFAGITEEGQPRDGLRAAGRLRRIRGRGRGLLLAAARRLVVFPVRRLPGQLPHRLAALLEGGTAGRIHRARRRPPESPSPRAHPRRRRRRGHGRRATRPHPGL